MSDISKEQIDEIFERVSKQTLYNVQEQYLSILDNFSEEQKKMCIRDRYRKVEFRDCR